MSAKNNTKTARGAQFIKTKRRHKHSRLSLIGGYRRHCGFDILHKEESEIRKRKARCFPPSNPVNDDKDK
eukprot:scaffold333988_cov28-Attheya_sp.AAC.1